MGRPGRLAGKWAGGEEDVEPGAILSPPRRSDRCCAYRCESAAASSAGGVPSGQLGTSAGTTIPSIFRLVQIWATTFNSSLRSNVPARIVTKPGRALFVFQTRVKQTGHARWREVR